MSQYKVFLDGVELSNEPIGLKDFEIEVVREDGFSGSDQILRDKTTTELSFVGDGYRYLCIKKQDNFCGAVIITIQYMCGSEFEDIFIGTIPIIKVEFDITRCIAKTEIRDSSFTGKLKDLSKTQLPLFNGRTKNCLGLSQVSKLILFDTFSVTSFDVLDTFKYFVGFITDNEIQVVSDYLTENKLAITTGYNLHNTTGSLIQVFPTLSFYDLFYEVRKKTRIFLGIEYDTQGNPYLRIENEDYFYTDNKVLEFTDIPYGIIEKVDTSRIFNSIESGSNNTELQPEDSGFVDGYTADPYDPTDLNRTWDKQTFTSCGQCTNDSNSEQNRLDLVSSFIIDTDVIYEALNAVPTTINNKYTHDNSIFMFEYSGTPDTANYTLDVPTGVYIYNANLINETVIENWFGYTPQCITLKNSTENYFLVQRDYAQQAVSNTENACLPDGTAPVNSALYDVNPFPTTVNEIFDNGNNVVGFTFTCPQNGNYVFKQSTDIQYEGGTFPNINDTQPQYQPVFVIYDAGGILLDIIYGDLYTPTTIQQLMSTEFTSPIITLNTGYTVRAGMSICRYGTIDPNFDFYDLTNTKFELLQDVGTCDTTQDDSDSKPILLEFRNKLCYSDLKVIRDDKRGYVSINNNPYWIKSIRWRENELTEFTLIGNVSLCPC